MEAKFQNVMNEDVRALKDRWENLKTHKREHQEGFYQVFCCKILKKFWTFSQIPIISLTQKAGEN